MAKMRFGSYSDKRGYTGSASAGEDTKTVRIPCVGNLKFRGTTASKDQQFLNGYFQVLKNPVAEEVTYHFIKRPGSTQLNRPPAGNATGRGCYSWNGKIYTVAGTKIYSGTTDLGVTLTTSSGICGFQEVRPGVATRYLAVNDGAKLYCISTSDVVTTVTVNFPTPNTRDLIYADGYLFTLKTDGTMWNCAVDDPTSWSASAFITAQMYNGSGVGLARQGNLIFLWSDKHMQAFHDAANAVGSPFSNVEEVAQQVGCAAQATIASDDRFTCWVGQSTPGSWTVWKLDGTTGLKEIGNDTIQNVLQGEGSSVSACYAYQLRVNGKFLYVLHLTVADRTFVYDHETDLWTEWQDASGSGKYPIVSVTRHNGALIGQHATNGYLYTISPTTYQDDSVSFPFSLRLSRVDFNNNRRKFVRRLELVGDQAASTANVTLSYSDDDYNTTVTHGTLDMSLARPFASNLGNFRRRSWQLSYSGNLPMRWEAIELEIAMGEA